VEGRIVEVCPGRFGALATAIVIVHSFELVAAAGERVHAALDIAGVDVVGIDSRLLRNGVLVREADEIGDEVDPQGPIKACSDLVESQASDSHAEKQGHRAAVLMQSERPSL